MHTYNRLSLPTRKKTRPSIWYRITSALYYWIRSLQNDVTLLCNITKITTRLYIGSLSQKKSFNQPHFERILLDRSISTSGDNMLANFHHIFVFWINENERIEKKWSVIRLRKFFFESESCLPFLWRSSFREFVFKCVHTLSSGIYAGIVRFQTCEWTIQSVLETWNIAFFTKIITVIAEMFFHFEPRGTWRKRNGMAIKSSNSTIHTRVNAILEIYSEK